MTTVNPVNDMDKGEQLLLALMVEEAVCDRHADKDWEVTLGGNGTNAHEASNAYGEIVSIGMSIIQPTDERLAVLRELAEKEADSQMADIYGEDWNED